MSLCLNEEFGERQEENNNHLYGFRINERKDLLMTCFDLIRGNELHFLRK